MKFSKVGIALAGVAVLLAVPVVPVAASESATGSTIAEFKVTGKRPKPEPTVLPPRRRRETGCLARKAWCRDICRRLATKEMLGGHWPELR